MSDQNSPWTFDYPVTDKNDQVKEVRISVEDVVQKCAAVSQMLTARGEPTTTDHVTMAYHKRLGRKEHRREVASRQVWVVVAARYHMDTDGRIIRLMKAPSSITPPKEVLGLVKPHMTAPDLSDVPAKDLEAIYEHLSEMEKNPDRKILPDYGIRISH